MENSYGFVEVEPHVAQQSRRDKLRVPQNLSFLHGSDSLDLVRIQSFKNGISLPPDNDQLSLFPSDETMINFSRDLVGNHEDASASSFSNCYWKSSHHDHNHSHPEHQSCDWVVNCDNSITPRPPPGSMLNDHIGFQKRVGDLQFPPPPLPVYQNALQEDLEMTSIVQHNFTEINQPGNDTAGSWTDRAFYNCRGWVGELGSIARKTDEDQLRSSFVSDSNPQGLSLSLSSNPSSKFPATAQFIEEQEELQESVKNVKAESLCRLPKPSVACKSYGKSLQDAMGVGVVPVNSYRNTGPLGPFTGYATILKSSKFLKPAQLLLDEFCGSNGQKFVEPQTSDAALNELRNEVVKGNSSCGEVSTFCGSNETNVSGVGSISSESHQPEHQQKKAKLIYMLEEVCRRYKQYHQQMQMVVSSFESVAGLSSATPYISLALKTVSKHFRCLKTAISDQLKYLRKALGEDLPSPSAGTSGSKGDPNSARLQYNNMEQSSCFQKQKSGIVNNMGFLESQHVWRPQRGLPERAVAILRAWLFEHFLHPYPTDTDKHMLATQTGLSRNQVSNWFINARVRVWKPMVEEIHMLETKGLTEMNKSHSTNKDGSCTIENNTSGWSSSSEQQHPLKSHDVVNEIAANHHHFQCLGVDSSSGHHRNGLTSDPQPTKLGMDMDGELMGFVPYRPSGVEVGGLGAVSLTLGLRHRVESAHHQQQRQLQPQDDQLIRHFGGEMIHDFVG